ncbi:MAG: pitrilysin family protein [Saprospiraceae bacterium]|nr:pitrilysin family protein [Saprospiraceae bacterium]
MQAPPISEIRHLTLPPVRKFSLPNDISVTSLHDPLAEYVRFEIVFEAGRYQESQKLISKAAALLMKEGTVNLSRKQISEIFDSKGATLQVRNSLDYTFLSFVCLSEYATELLEVAASMCIEPAYEEVEVAKYRKLQARKLEIELRKTEVVAYREMTSLVFGENSPYGYNSEVADYAELQRDDIIRFHNKHILKGKKHIFVTGFIGSGFLDKVSDLFGIDQLECRYSNGEFNVEIQRSSISAHFEMPTAVQSSVRLFRPLFNRRHDDYARAFLLNIVLGGYFGSRLMKNIREDQGLTYGIYSSLDTLKHSGYLYISTETRHENVKKVLNLVNMEMQTLCETPCRNDELLMVKRYIAGQFLRMIDGPLNVMKVYRTLALDRLPSQHYDELLEKIWRCSPHDLLHIAQSYLKPDQFSLITVGKIDEQTT